MYHNATNNDNNANANDKCLPSTPLTARVASGIYTYIYIYIYIYTHTHVYIYI